MIQHDWTWGYSHDGEMFCTGYASRQEALEDGAHGYGGEEDITTARCRPWPLHYGVEQEELDDYLADLDSGEATPRAMAEWLIECFIGQNEEADFEGGRFEDAEVDDELLAAIRPGMTAEQATAALEAWGARYGHFPYGCTLDCRDRRTTPAHDAVLLIFDPARPRQYDWRTRRVRGWDCHPIGVEDLEFWPYPSDYGVGLADMPNYAPWPGGAHD